MRDDGTVQPDSQPVAKTPAQIQSDACGVLKPPSVLSDKAFFKDTGKVALGNADTVIFYVQKYLIALFFGKKMHIRLTGAVFHGIADNLV